MSNKNWTITVVALVVAALLAIGGVIVYGTYIQPGERKAADIAACDIFEAGAMNASNEAYTLSQKTPKMTDADIAQKYLEIIDVAIDKAFLKAASKSDVANALAQLGISRISYDATMGVEAVTALQTGFDPVITACNVVEPTPAATPTPTASN
jgi:hypothetical protein